MDINGSLPMALSPQPHFQAGPSCQSQGFNGISLMANQGFCKRGFHLFFSFLYFNRAFDLFFVLFGRCLLKNVYEG